MKIFLKSFFLFILSVFASFPARAETNYFSVNVYFDSATEDVNAFEASLTYPVNWTIENITLRDSDYIYWIQTPQKGLNGRLDFSGIFPGGVQNLENYSSPLLLYSVDFSGDFNEATSIALQDPTINLNHPMALEATEASLSYEVGLSDSLEFVTDFSALDHLDYEFVTDPVNGQQALVINNYRGALAAYTFEVREGDFGMGAWSRANGVSLLSDENSTVELFVASPTGQESRFVLRNSMARYAAIGVGVLLGTGIILYFFFIVFKTLRNEGPLPKAAPRERTKLM